MSVLMPKFIAIDSATLGRMSSDYWSSSVARRDKVRQTIDELVKSSIYITISFTHVCELFRHEDDSVADERFSFLRNLPMIAWVRPYSGNWFVGGMEDLLLYELHAFVYESIRGWPEIIEEVRPKILETGVGEDMFGQSPKIWSYVRSHARKELLNQICISSIARADPYEACNTKLGDYESTTAIAIDSAREHQDLETLRKGFEQNIKQHGDKRAPVSSSARFILKLVKEDVEAVKATGGNPYHTLFKKYGIPKDLIRPTMTVGEVASLAVYAAHIDTLGEHLKPSVRLSASDIPPESLPSFTLQRALAIEQQKAERVSGSDLGDERITSLSLYLDAIEVDKRTHHHMKRICKSSVALAEVVRPVFKINDYGDIHLQAKRVC